MVPRPGASDLYVHQERAGLSPPPLASTQRLQSTTKTDISLSILFAPVAARFDSQLRADEVLTAPGAAGATPTLYSSAHLNQHYVH